MAYVPGYEHDVFISYAHGDDRAWISHLINRLKDELGRRLGIQPTIWMDDDGLRRSSDFHKEIPASVTSSAVFLLFPSPTYLRSEYCVLRECKAFEETVPLKKERFAGDDFANQQFALRCPLLPVDNNEHWQLFPGLTDIRFCDEAWTFPVSSPEFEASYRKLFDELLTLLYRMRNRSIPVFVYPAHPTPRLEEVHEALSKELSAHSYRLLPEGFVSLSDQLRKAAVSVFLVGDLYDESLDRLTTVARSSGKPWVVWCSPTSQEASPEQAWFIGQLETFPSPTKTFFNLTIPISEVKREVLDLLRPNGSVFQRSSDKPRIYVVYNSHDSTEKRNAGQIMYKYRDEFHFDSLDDRGQHTARLAGSEGVLLVWGNSKESWWVPEFETMLQVSRRAKSKGLCFFDPKETKTAVLSQLRSGAADIHIIEQFGEFNPARLEPFFESIRRKRAMGAP
jgi:hypothetical protein